MNTQNNIIKHADERNDKWGRDVKGRISNAIDLVAKKAAYHDKCYREFFRKSRERKSITPGRPPSDDVTSAMETIYYYLENSDDCQFSFEELINQIEGYVPHESTIKQK